MTIPALLLNDLDHVLRDSTDNTIPWRVTLLMRHSVRFPIINPADTYVVGLTEAGVRLAEELGALLARSFLPGRLRSSPVGRCRATAEAIARGAGWPAKVRADRRLSHPYIEPAWNLVESGRLNGGLPEPIPQVLSWAVGPPETARQAYLPLLEDCPKLDVLVTHDTIVGAMVNCLLREPVLGPAWPGYLEGVLFWWSEGRVHARWRGIEQVFSPQFTRVEVS